MLFLQLPASLPFVKRSASVKGKEMAGRLKPFKGVGLSENGCSLEELPPGFMGKMLVYKSGSIKLKLGDILYDVSTYHNLWSFVVFLHVSISFERNHTHTHTHTQRTF